MSKMMRVGYGEDIHVLVDGRDLMLGGIKVPSDKGEKAHSDGDVLLHALSDALLGALALGDIGKHFPDNLEETKGMDSKIILDKVYKMVKEKGYHLVNADMMVILERPKIKDYILPMRESIAKVLEVDVNAISVKAGTNEGLDAIGRGEAIKATAIVLLESDN
ncbi:MAG: 2-C-methyl-D-erythritol 2,4-cyclodiphosphate synthase [Bacilli bacterium]|nr:2-C-methyl-D-erythritol 2,4-cyclodiphosphate synthase [Bacilli bacterium]